MPDSDARFGFHARSDRAELRGTTEYGEIVSIHLFPQKEPGTYDLSLTIQGREPERHRFVARDAEFLGNKLQLKGPFLRIVLDTATARKFCKYLSP